jgi:hypothetical protein
VPQIHIQFEGVRRDQVDEQLLDEATERLKTVVALDEVEIIVAGDLAASVRRRLPDDQAAMFSVDRVSGRVGAKMIPTLDGCAIVIDGRLLVPGAAMAAEIDVARLFEHEAWHGALSHHAEDFHAAFSRLSIEGAQAHYVGQALVLVDDYRIERALFEQGSTLDASYVPSTTETLDGCAAALLDAVTLRYPGEPMTRCFETAVPAFNSLTTHLGYLAAADADIGALRGLPRWRGLVRNHYDRMKETLEALPSASERVEPAKIDATAIELGQVLEAWLRDVGFVLRDVPTGLYLDVLRHDF